MVLLSLPLLISLRFSRGRYHAIMTSLISIISVVGITIGVAVLIISLSSMNGFKRELNNRIFAVIPHSEFISINQPWKNWLPTLKKIMQVAGVSAAAPYVNFTGIIENGVNLCVIQVRGIDPKQEEKLSALPQFVQNGAWADFKSDKQQIIIGKGIADTMNLKEGDWISMRIRNPTKIDHKLQQLRSIRLQVIGILQISGQLDHNFAVVPLKDARVYMEIGNGITGIAIKANNLFNIKEVLRRAEEVIDSYIYIKSWINSYGYIYRDIQMIRSIMYLAMLLLVSIACFNIISTLLIVVKEKSNDIAVLRTLGAKDNFIRSIFVWYGLLTGITGSIFGLIIGVVISLRLTLIIRYIEYYLGYKFMSDDVYFINFLPSELHWVDVICILLEVISLSLLASWYPAHRANCIDPVKLLSIQ